MPDPAVPEPSGDMRTGDIGPAGGGSPATVTLSSAFVRNALESSPEATVIVDDSGVIVFTNQQLNSLFGYTSEEILGESVELLMPECFHAQHVEHRARFKEDSRPRPMGTGLELSARHKDGAEFPVEISLSPMQNDGAPLIIAAIRDITERRRIQSELTTAREAADQANQAKSRFLATASHDLRQPLQTLSLLNGTLRRMVPEAAALEVISQQEQAIGAMSRLLNALLDIGKLESGAVKPEPADFAVTAVLEELRNEFAGIAATKGLEFRVEATADYAHSDRSLVGQILRNLVANAIKYTRQGGVRLRGLSHSPGIRVEVMDTGIGIPADQLPHIYDEFYQVGVSPNTSREGYGLGLSIVRRLAQLLQLKLEVHSELGKGSVFALELPPGKKATAPPREYAAPAPSLGEHLVAPLVLLVEDDAAVRNATRLLLKIEGYRVLTAGSLAEARERATEHPRIELLVTDYHLGNGQTGIQVISEMRGLVGPSLKAILLTGDTSSAVRELEREHYVRLASKPINADELLGMMKRLLTI